MKVLVTGSSSCLARVLLPMLCAQEHVERLTGVDLAAPNYAHPKFHATHCDIRDVRMRTLLKGHDALVHLAFVVLRGRMNAAEMDDINVRGSHSLFVAAREAGVARLIHMSSAAVYGSGANLVEAAPLAPLPGFLYAAHKARLERLLEADVPECVRLRPHAILGPNAQPLLRQLIRLPFYPALPEPYPRLQCVHEQDAARAVLLAMERNVHGPFNLAASDSVTYRDLARRRHRIAVPLAMAVARPCLRAAVRLTSWGGEAAWLDGLARTLTLDCGRAQRELGWLAHYDSTLACVAETP